VYIPTRPPRWHASEIPCPLFPGFGGRI